MVYWSRVVSSHPGKHQNTRWMLCWLFSPNKTLLRPLNDDFKRRWVLKVKKSTISENTVANNFYKLWNSWWNVSFEISITIQNLCQRKVVHSFIHLNVKIVFISTNEKSKKIFFLVWSKRVLTWVMLTSEVQWVCRCVCSLFKQRIVYLLEISTWK